MRAQRPPKWIEKRAQGDADSLVERFTEPHPHKPGVENARLARYGFSVWILIDPLDASGQDAALVVEEYGAPAEAIEAVRQYYLVHQAPIDALINEHAVFHGAAVR